MTEKNNNIVHVNINGNPQDLSYNSASFQKDHRSNSDIISANNFIINHHRTGLVNEDEFKVQENYGTTASSSATAGFNGNN